MRSKIEMPADMVTVVSKSINNSNYLYMFVVLIYEYF